MKKLFPPIFVLFLIACSSADNNEETNPTLSFTFEQGPRFASSEINVTNNSSNYTGDYIWEVTSSNETITASTKDLSFTPTIIGQHFITLKTIDGAFEKRESLNITPPSFKILKDISLKQVEKAYETLYFRLIRNTIAEGLSVAYSSEIKENITPTNASEVIWNIENDENILELVVAGSGTASFSGLSIEFYDGDNNLLSKLEPSFFNTYDENTVFENGEVLLTTTRIDCAACDDFQVAVDIEYENQP